MRAVSIAEVSLGVASFTPDYAGVAPMGPSFGWPGFYRDDWVENVLIDGGGEDLLTEL